jgi:methionyl aminopeptidase
MLCIFLINIFTSDDDFMNPDVIDSYLEAGRIAARVRDETAKTIEEGMRLIDIAEYAEDLTHKMGACVAFPCNISINEIASHYTPLHGTQKIAPHDLVKIDVGVHVNGYIADTATSIEVGTHHNHIIIQAAKEALDAAINEIRDGVNTKKLGVLIEKVIRSHDCNPVNNLTGHSIERYTIHSGINIPNHNNTFGNILRAGDVIAIEPFTTQGSGQIKQEETRIYSLIHNNKSVDSLYQELGLKFNTLPFTTRWIGKSIELDKIRRFIRKYPVLTESDGYPVAQAEHTVIVQKYGCKVITD